MAPIFSGPSGPVSDPSTKFLLSTLSMYGKDVIYHESSQAIETTFENKAPIFSRSEPKMTPSSKFLYIIEH